VPLPPEEEVQTGLPMGADKEEKEVYIQKRMVDFVKRRVLVLEKVLNAEYQCMVCCQIQLLVSYPHLIQVLQFMSQICIQIYVVAEFLFDNPTTACGFQYSRFDKFLLVCCREENRSNLRSFHHK
jgi:hypothetical protein